MNVQQRVNEIITHHCIWMAETIVQIEHLLRPDDRPPVAGSAELREMRELVHQMTGSSGTVGFAQGGLITWKTADRWSPRIFANTFGYWSKFQTSSLTSTTAARQIVPVVRSRLSFPTELYTLGLLYQDAWASGRGDWEAPSMDRQTLSRASLRGTVFAEETFGVSKSVSPSPRSGHCRTVSQPIQPALSPPTTKYLPPPNQ